MGSLTCYGSRGHKNVDRATFECPHWYSSKLTDLKHKKFNATNTVHIKLYII